MAEQNCRETPCGLTLAYSYIEGYIMLILKAIDDGEILEEFKQKQKIGDVYKKIMILIPEKCMFPSDLAMYDPDNIKRVGKIRAHIHVSGMRNRPYDIDVFRISHQNEAVYAMLSLPSNLVTIPKMVYDPDLKCESIDMDVAKDQYIQSLKDIIKRKNLERTVEVISIPGTVPDEGLSEMLFYHISEERNGVVTRSMKQHYKWWK